MTPEIWGRYMWYSIHFVALEYPEAPTPQQKKDYQNFFVNLWKVLPCYTCSQNYKRHLSEQPLTDEHLQSKDTLFAWTVYLHNVVNKENGKPEMTVQAAKKMYTAKDFHSEACGGKNTRAAPTSVVQEQNKNNQVDMVLVGMLGLLLGIAVTWSLGHISIPALPKMLKGGNRT